MTQSSSFVFVHGGGQGSWIWDETLAAMDLQSGGKARCVALDVPGCGSKRGRDTAGMTFADIVEELVKDIDEAGVSEVVMVGHSQAGQILPKLESARPGLIARHIYVSCIAQSPGHTIEDAMRLQIESDPGGPFAAVYTDPQCSMRERMRVMFCNDMTLPEQEEFLDKLEMDAWPEIAYAETGWSYDHLGSSVPATYVECMQDQVLIPRWQRIYAERFRCTRTVHIDAAHQVQNTRPHALAEVLLAESRG